MVKWFLAALAAFFLTACGGGDPEEVTPIVEKEQPLLLLANSAQSLIGDFRVVYQRDDTSRFYQEGPQTVVRFDGAGSSNWVEYTLYSSSVNGVIVELRAPSQEIPGVFDVANVTWFMTSTGAIQASVDAHLSTGALKWSTDPYQLSRSLGMKSPAIGWFSGGTNMRDLISDPL
jgi:hypothetical protein